MPRFFRCAVPPALLLGVSVMTAPAASAADARTAADPKEVQAAIDRALKFLRDRQGEDGSFAPKLGGPGITALTAAGLIRCGRADDPVVAKSLKYLEKNIQKDGGIYNRALANYSTSVALIAFKEANAGGKYDGVIEKAAKFLKTLQFDPGDEKDALFGGVGYNGKGDKERPDLSNTQYFLDAMLAAGVPKDDPAVQRALKFISRCQNLPGETNDQPFAKKTSADDKGGFIYTPAEGGKSNAGETADGGLRSAGVMTYAGLKSFLYAGVSKNDPRVKAAVDWIRRHYTLAENPGQKAAGLYYYYHLFGKAMDALGEDRFKDAAGKEHDWRMELFEALKKQQRPDGSWSNSDKSYFENNPELATAYAVLALSYCLPPKK